jgi:hypothetical protein
MSITVQKIFNYFFVLCLLLTPLFSKQSLTQEISKLSQHQQWYRLLHFKNNQSEIDDPSFFFAKDGKTNPKSELTAFLQQLHTDTSDDENSTLCRYPSRGAWVLEQIPQLKQQIYIPKCQKLQKELKELNPKHITLVLASAHINSPASAFGHTFLRIDANPNTPLLSYAVNYAAQTTETNGFVYAYKGLTGGYKGRYSIDPYYKKLKEYANLEQRDIWEYALELSKEEIERMVLHIFEIRHFYADYLFLTENCSYNLLWLLEIATQKSNLINQFNYKAIPIDTLRAVIAQKLVKKVSYRASKRREILSIQKPIQNNPLAHSFAQSDEYNLSQITMLSKTEQIAALELASSLLKIKLENGDISKKSYLPKFLKLLKARSKLGIQKKEAIQTPTNPTQGHLSTKSTLAYTGNNAIKASIKIAYHDIYDNDDGYIPGAFINFFDTSFEYDKAEFDLEHINLLEIKSYAIQDSIFKPLSWEVAVGAKALFNNELHSYLKAGGGVTLGQDNLYVYTTLTPTLYYRKKTEESLALNVGLLYNPTPSLKLGLLNSQEWFSNKREMTRVEPFVTYSFNQEWALNIKHQYHEIDKLKSNETTLSLFWYF